MNTKICAAFESWFAARRTEPVGARTPTPVRPKIALPSKKLDDRIVPYEKWPGMYRLRRSDGSLSDMANLTRIKDALRSMDKKS
jgi:hypothetical protein